MTWPPPLRVLAPLLAGAGIGAVLQATVPDTRLYAAASPGLLAGLAGLLGAGVVAAVTLARAANRRGGGRGLRGDAAAGGGRGRQASGCAS